MDSSSGPLNNKPSIEMVRIYTNLKSIALLILSISNIFLCVTSTALQTAGMVKSSGSYYGFGALGLGIWCGVLYMITGLLGYSASYQKTKPLLRGAFVFSAMSILGSIAAAIISGVDAYFCYFEGISEYWQDRCDGSASYSWRSIEWSLVGVSCLAFIINLVVMIVIFFALCSKPKTTTLMYKGHHPQDEADTTATSIRKDGSCSSAIANSV